MRASAVFVVVGAMVSLQVSHAAHVIKDAGDLRARPLTYSLTHSLTHSLTPDRPTDRPTEMANSCTARSTPVGNALTQLSNFEFASYKWLAAP